MWNRQIQRPRSSLIVTFVKFSGFLFSKFGSWTFNQTLVIVDDYDKFSVNGPTGDQWRVLECDHQQVTDNAERGEVNLCFYMEIVVYTTIHNKIHLTPQTPYTKLNLLLFFFKDYAVWSS